MKKVYAIIANHNYSKYVAEAIQGCLSQTYKTNICIIDDGSTDNSVEIIVKTLFQSYTCYMADENTTIYTDGSNYFIENTKCVGASEARNMAMNLVMDKADYFLIADSDDVAYPTKVERLIEKFKYPGVAEVYADYIIEAGYNVPEYKIAYDARVLSYDCIVHSQSLISKVAIQEILENGKIYDPNLHGPATSQFIGSMEDWDLHIRLAEKFMIFHVPELLTKVRVHGNNASSVSKVTNEIYSKNLAIIREKAKQREQIHLSS